MVEAERSGYSRNLRGSHDDKLQTGAHVRMLHLISERHTPPTTAIQTGQSHRKGMRSTGSEALVNYHRSPSPHSPDAPVIFCTLVLRCWCHRPSWAPASPPVSHLSLHHSSRSSAGQFISLLSWHFHLASCPSHTTFLHFRHLADADI